MRFKRIQKIISGIITSIALIIGLFSSLITIIDHYDVYDFKSPKVEIELNIISFEFILLFILKYKWWIIIISFGVSGYLLLLQYLKTKGDRKIPISFKVFFNKINPFTLYKIIELIHEFQHKYDFAESSIKSINSTEKAIKGKELIAKLLLQSQKIIQTATKSYVSVHIKVFESKGNSAENEIQTLDIKNVYLKTYERIPSLIESNRCKCKKINPRKNTELFIISNSYPAHVQDAIAYDVKSKKMKKNQPLKVNSAYNYVLGANEHYWISNNLKIDRKRNYFFCTSDNYEEYYNSLAVFPIAPPVTANEDLESDLPIGLFIIDSYDCGVFDKYFIGQIAGYISHRLYNLFLLLE